MPELLSPLFSCVLTMEKKERIYVISTDFIVTKDLSQRTFWDFPSWCKFSESSGI